MCVRVSVCGREREREREREVAYDDDHVQFLDTTIQCVETKHDSWMMNGSLTFVRFRGGGGFEIVFDQCNCGLDLRGCHGFCEFWRKHTWDGRSGLTYHHMECICVCVCVEKLGTLRFLRFLRFYESLYSLSLSNLVDNE